MKIIFCNKNESSDHLYQYFKNRSSPKYIIDYILDIHRIGIHLIKSFSAGSLHPMDVYMLFDD